MIIGENKRYMIKHIINKFINKIHGIDTSIDENYFRVPRYLMYEIIEEFEKELEKQNSDK